MFLLFSLIIGLYVLILAVIVQIFVPTTELKKLRKETIKEAKAEIETHLVTAEAKIKSVQHNLKSHKPVVIFDH